MRQAAYQELAREFLKYDPLTGLFEWAKSPARNVKVGDRTGTKSKKNGYVWIAFRGFKFSAHRLAWLAYYGYEPESELDHINRDKSDNRIMNLREVSPQQNKQNLGLQTRNKTGVSGVYYHKGRDKYTVTIGYHGCINLGTYSNLLDAAAARKSAEIKYWGIYDLL